MPAHKTRGTLSYPHIGLVALIFAITAGAALAGSTRSSREPERISVTAVSGTVSVTMGGSVTPVQPDATVSLPARIITGGDGMLTLTQAGTNVTIAADSDVEIPAEAADGQLIARLVQRRGNVFYDVAHREVGTLRVETPFLVAVIKGTQFNVAAQDDGTTISLFQGRLDIRTPDGGNSVIINAGQIASRNNAGGAIRVIGMNDVRLELPRSSDVVARSDDAIQPRVFVAADGRDAPAGSARSIDAGRVRLESVSSATDLDLGATASLGRGLQGGNGSTNVSLGAGVGVGAGGVPASVGANLNVGTGSSGVSLGAGAGLGAGSVPPSIGANLNVGTGTPGVSLGTGAGVSVGSTSVGGTVTVDLGNNGLHLGTGGSIGDNAGLHLGNGNGGIPAPPGKLHGP